MLQNIFRMCDLELMKKGFDSLPCRCNGSFMLNLLMNAFVHLYLAFYVVFISLKTLYLSEARCTHTRDHYCTHNVLYFVPYILIIILITYSILFHDLFIYFYHTFIYYFTCIP